MADRLTEMRATTSRLRASTSRAATSRTVGFSDAEGPTRPNTRARTGSKRYREAKEGAVPEAPRPGTEYARVTTSRSATTVETGFGGAPRPATRPESAGEAFFARHGVPEPLAARAARRAREAAIKAAKDGGPRFTGFLIPDPEDSPWNPSNMADLADAEKAKMLRRQTRSANAPLQLQAYWDLRHGIGLNTEQLEPGSSPDWNDWYLDLPQVLRYTEDYLTARRPCRVLNLGCGVSRLTHGLEEALPHVVTDSVDLSTTLVRKLTKFWADQPDREGLSIRWGDVRDLTVQAPDGSYDVVIDKATFDTLLLGPSGVPSVRRCLQECWRVLRPEGVLMIFTTGTSLMRTQYFERSNAYTSAPEKQTYRWTVGRMAHSTGFIHVLTKRALLRSGHAERMARERDALLRRLRAAAPHFSSVNLDQFFLDCDTLKVMDRSGVEEMLRRHEPGYVPPKGGVDDDTSSDESCDAPESARGDEAKVDPVTALLRLQEDRKRRRREDRVRARIGKKEPGKLGIEAEAAAWAKRLKAKDRKEKAEAHAYLHVETEEERAARVKRELARLPQCAPVDPAHQWREDDAREARGGEERE
jgi:SAM-dependent methyltransferase